MAVSILYMIAAASFLQNFIFAPMKLYRVKVTLEEFLDRNGLPQVQSFDEFPDSITISQVIDAWKCIIDYQCKIKQA